MNVSTASTAPDFRDAIDRGIDVTLDCRGDHEAVRRHEPVTFGLPLPRGAAIDVDRFALYDGEGRGIATHTRVLDRWPDGSSRWLLIDAQVDYVPGALNRLTLRRRPGAPVRASLARADGGQVLVDTGRALFRLKTGGSCVFDEVRVSGCPALDARRSALSATDEHGRDCLVRFTRLEIEDSNAMRAVVAAEGTIQAPDGSLLLELLVRIHFYVDLPTIRMLVRARNPRAAGHPGGYWDLGSGGAAYLKELAWAFAAPRDGSPADVSCAVESGETLNQYSAPVVLYQDSSGGENWRSANHVNRRRVVPNQFRGYRLESTEGVREGRRATPVLRIAHGGGALAAAIPGFWQNFPKALEARDAVLAVGLFPRQYADVHEMQGGEQKTHELFLSFADDDVSAEPLSWCCGRIVARAAPAWYCATGAIPYLTPFDEASDRPRAALIHAAIEGNDTFERKREVVDEYGWRHFGDIYGDHEGVRHHGDAPLVSHYNNQYDPIGGFAQQFMRTGDGRWWTQMDELAAHVVDIDIYHTVEDKWAYNHGLFWHTFHYGDADTATHRSYPRAAAARIGGGGPSPDQNYTTGLTLHYFLTGEAASREAALELAQYVIDADDGARTIFRWLDRGPTGYASASGSYSYHGPGRSPANSQNALLDGYRLTGRKAFLEKAEELIRRCVHPEEDIAALDLLDAERRWFYTMFLQSLGKYLDDKAERGELDTMYGYGRASLLHYARWMAAHETPFLDRAGRLEFPTETWAAQDIRKSDIFYYAARHAAGAERDQFLERAVYFFRYATDTLHASPTRTLARPVVILLSNGSLHAWCTLHMTSAPEPEGAASFPPRQSFVPQKVRAKKKAVLLAAAGAGALALAAGLWLRTLAEFQ